MDESLAHVIRHFGLEPYRDQLAPHARRSIRLVRGEAAGVHRPGSSRLGGLPDLPPGVDWPRRDLVGTPLAFLAQVNLAEVAPADLERVLPATGILYFFVDPEDYFDFAPGDQDRWRVLYSESIPTEGPTPAPSDLGDAGRFPTYSVTSVPEWSLHHARVDDLPLTDSEREEYLDALPESPVHQLLGHPLPIQGDVMEDIASAVRNHFDSPGERRTPRLAAEDWTLLLQIDSHYEQNGWMWGDGGMLYFGIRREDLAVHRFDRVWLMMQCG